MTVELHIDDSRAAELVVVSTGRIREFAPRFSVGHKEGSWLHRLIGTFAPTYLSSAWTTLNYTAMAPAGRVTRWRARDWRAVWHEGRHAEFHHRYTRVLMWALYLLPWVRARIEARCYAVQMTIDHALGEWNGLSLNETVTKYDDVIGWLSGALYLWPATRGMAERMVRAEIHRISIKGDLRPYERAAESYAKKVLNEDL
jgi:hypothetical protein